MIELAIAAGFEKYEDCSLSSSFHWEEKKDSAAAEDDETLQVGEYPVGYAVLKFAELVQAEAAKRRG